MWIPLYFRKTRIVLKDPKQGPLSPQKIFFKRGRQGYISAERTFIEKNLSAKRTGGIFHRN